MRANFLDAFERHLKDADILYTQKRFANSDHLYGLAFECGLKCLMVRFGMPVDDSGDPKDIKKDRKHANRILDRYQAYQQGYNHGTKYPLQEAESFSSWDINQRYADSTHFTEASVQLHQNDARKVETLIKNAKRDGFLP